MAWNNRNPQYMPHIVVGKATIAQNETASQYENAGNTTMSGSRKALTHVTKMLDNFTSSYNRACDASSDDRQSERMVQRMYADQPSANTTITNDSFNC